jgi:hypothetical protein
VPINIYNAYPGSELFDEIFATGKIKLNDQYFLGLQSLNSDYTNMRPINYNKHIGIRELALYRIGFMLLNYLLSYVFYPKRIWRTFRNLTTGKSAATVLEHRLIDHFRRRRVDAAQTARTL